MRCRLGLKASVLGACGLSAETLPSRPLNGSSTTTRQTKTPKANPRAAKSRFMYQRDRCCDHGQDIHETRPRNRLKPRAQGERVPLIRGRFPGRQGVALGEQLLVVHGADQGAPVLKNSLNRLFKEGSLKKWCCFRLKHLKYKRLDGFRDLQGAKNVLGSRVRAWSGSECGFGMLRCGMWSLGWPLLKNGLEYS